MTGTIKRLKKQDGYGFIRGEDGKEYFMHRTAVKNADFGQLEEGQEVTFEDVEADRGPRAEDVFV